jgi:glycosyltransferase involved in cell wall biosynthesis
MSSPVLRIGLAGPLPPPSGGIANQTLQLAALLRAEGFLVEMVQFNPPYRPAWTGKIRFLRAIVRLFPYLVQLWRTAAKVQMLHVMANSGWSWHLFAAPAVWVAHLRGIPVIVNYRGGEAAAFLDKAAAVVRFTMKRTDALIVPSGFLEGIFARHGMPSRVIPNVVDIARFPQRSTVPASGRAPCLLAARNLEAIYDNATALRTLALLHKTHPGATLLIAGSGPQRRQLEALAAELGVARAVTFTGAVAHHGMAALYKKADVVLNCALADNMPNSLLEAMASGVPVVSSAVGGVPFLVQHERTALLVPPQSPVAMAQAVARLLDDAALYGAIRQAALKDVQQYTWTGIRPRLLAVYERAVATRYAATAVDAS